MPHLALPRTAVVPSFVSAGLREGDDAHVEYGLTAVRRAQQDSRAYVEALLVDVREHAPRPDGWVPSTHLWWVEGDDYLGRLQIRHRLNPFLREVGGHIGYHVLPGHRRRGHATAMLAAALPVARSLGLECVLLTCDADNTASRRVIERNGGLLEQERAGTLRWWVPTDRP